MDARYKIAEAMMRGVGQTMAAFPDQRQDADMSLRGMASDLYQADQRRAQDYRAGISDALMQSWPAELAKSAYGAVTLPGDVYAGKVNPMSDEAVGRAAEFAGLMTLGAGGIPAGKNEMRMGIKAYHASPHDFDQFSMSKIGTGEGAQLFGHGLYFADSPKVSGRGGSYDVQFTNDLREPLERALKKYNRDPDAVRSAALLEIERLNSLPNQGNDPERFARMLGAQQKIVSGIDTLKHTGELPKAKIYEVNLNTTPDRLLDWDKPLSGQPAKAQKYLDAELRRYLSSAYDGQIHNYKDLPAGELLAQTKGTMANAPATSKEMKKAGIPGIKYLDAGSRAAGDGSRNYVMFDDKLVQILRKYGVATAAALPAAALAELGMSREEAKRSF